MLRRPRSRVAGASVGDCRGAGAEAGYLAFGRTHQSFGSAGIKWLETLLQSASFASVIVSHDRYFLENVANEIVELNPAYEDGALRVSGNYSAFLEAKELYLHAQRNRQEALENRVHTEIDWLRRGPKARTTKSKARIDKAHEMIGELAEMNSRTREHQREDRFRGVGAADQAIDYAGRRELRDGRANTFQRHSFHYHFWDCAWGWLDRMAAGRRRCSGC